MKDESKAAIAEPIAQLQSQLEQFRNFHAPRSRIPEALWRTAVELAGQHGLYAVAHALHLDYAGLKRRLAEVAGVGYKKQSRSPGFVGVRNRVGVQEGRPDTHSVEGIRSA